MLDPIYYAVSAVMWCWHQVFGLLLGPSSGAAWVLSVVFLVLTLRAAMIKPFLAQVRSGRAMRTLAPQLAELRTRHAGDPARLAQETKALQSEHGVNVLGGCLPALLQVPVFIGLLHVLRSFNRPGLSFGQNAAIANYAFPPDEVGSFLHARIFGTPLSAYLSMPQNLLDSFGAHVDRWEVVAVAVPLMLLAAVATHVTARHSLAQQAGRPTAGLPGGASTASIMAWMPWIFPLGVLVGGTFFAFPIAILVYWLTNNGWTLVQQRIVYRRVAAEVPRVPVPVAARVEPAPEPAPPPRRAAASSKPRRNSSGHRPSRRRR